MTRSRRSYLSFLGVGASALAGCATSVEDRATTEAEEPTATETERPTTTETTETTERTDVTTTENATSTTTDRQSKFEVAQINVVNKRPEPHRFHVLVLAGETPVFWRSYRAEAAEYEDGRVAKATGTVWKDPLPEMDDFSVHARVDDRTEWESWSPNEESEECLYLEVQLGSDRYLRLQRGFGC